MQETWVQSLVWEDPLEDGMATPSSVLAGRIPWTEVPGGIQSTGSQGDTTEQLSTAPSKRVSRVSVNETCGFSLFLNPETNVRNSVLCL